MIDSNVLVDLFDTSEWTLWSQRKLSSGQLRDRLVVNPVIRAEIAGRFDSLQQQSDFLDDLGIGTLPLDLASAFRAGQAHRLYRQRGGEREPILADFLIGGHAASLGAALLTRDRHRFATYFPELTLITPETGNG